MKQAMVIITIILTIIAGNDAKATSGSMSYADVQFDTFPAPYGFDSSGSITGVLVLPANETYRLECPSKQEPLDINPYIEYVENISISSNYILMIEGRYCGSIYKVKHAENLGASAAVVCDNSELGQPADYPYTINIPAFRITTYDCEILMAHLGVSDWQRYDMMYPTPESMQLTVSTFTWQWESDETEIKPQTRINQLNLDSDPDKGIWHWILQNAWIFALVGIFVVVVLCNVYMTKRRNKKVKVEHHHQYKTNEVGLTASHILTAKGLTAEEIAAKYYPYSYARGGIGKKNTLQMVQKGIANGTIRN